MRASYRALLDQSLFYGVVLLGRRLTWFCPHSHDSRKKALACARRHIKEVPATRRGQLSHLRRTWKATEPIIPTDPDDGRPMFSRTFIENFIQCVQYQDDRSPDAAFGTAVHAAIHAYYQLCVSTGRDSSLSDVDRLVRDAYFTTPNGSDPGRYEEARELVHEYVSNQPANLGDLLIVDRRPALEFDLKADCGWFWLTGRADRIDRVDGDDPDDPPRIIRIRDIKTGWDPNARQRKVPGRPEVGHAPVPHDFQRRVYAMAAFLDPRLNARLEAVETVIDYPRNRRNPEILSYERPDLEMWWQDIVWALTQRWQQRTGPPTGSAACEYCALRITCGAATTEAKAIPSSVEEAKDRAQEIIRIRRMQRSKSVGLQKFMRGRDLMVVNGLEMGFAPSRTPTWKVTDPLKVVSHLNALGYNGQAAMVSWIDPAMVPDEQKASLVEAGAARWDQGPVGWKMRKAGTDEEVES